MTHVKRLLIGACLIAIVVFAAWRGNQFQTAQMAPKQPAVSEANVQLLPSDAMPPAPLPAATSEYYQPTDCTELIPGSQLAGIFRAAEIYAGFPSSRPVEQDIQLLAANVLPGPFLKSTQSSWMNSGSPNRRSTSVKVIECYAGDQDNLIQLLSVILRINSVDGVGYKRADTVSYDMSVVRTAERYVVVSIVPKGMYGGGGDAAAD